MPRRTSHRVRAPPPGEVHATARVRITNLNPNPRHFDAANRLRLIGPSGTPRSSFDHDCGPIPGELVDPTVSAGETAEGEVCWRVPAGETAAPVLLVEADVPVSDRYVPLT